MSLLTRAGGVCFRVVHMSIRISVYSSIIPYFTLWSVSAVTELWWTWYLKNAWRNYKLLQIWQIFQIGLSDYSLLAIGQRSRSQSPNVHSVFAAYYFECNMWITFWIHFLKFGTNIQLESIMNCDVFSGQRSRSYWPHLYPVFVNWYVSAERIFGQRS